MQLTIYDDIVRHLYKFPEQRLFIHEEEDKTLSVINVQLHCGGLQVLTENNEWKSVEFVKSDLDLDVFNSPKPEKGKKMRNQ